MKHIVFGVVAAGISSLLFGCMNDSQRTNEQRLPEFKLSHTDYGWTGAFPGEPYSLFGKPVRLQVDTRMVPDHPKSLPPVSVQQAALARAITPALPAILKRVEEAMIEYNKHDPDFRSFVKDPQVWLDSERDDGGSWTFVIERTDNPDFGYHLEFKGTNYVEIWAGD